VQPVLPRPVFDLDLLNKNWGAGKDILYRRILGLFQAEAEKLVQDIHTAVQQDNRVALARLAHTLKGVAGNVCALSFSQSAGLLECGAATATMAELQAMLMVMDADWRCVAAAIDQGGPPCGR
jgi:HPt (histidine-containing phosphotransfer) domain-containing protein